MELLNWQRMILVLCVLLAGGCKPPAPAVPPPASNPVSSGPPPLAITPMGYYNQAQPRMHTMKVFLGACELITEMATNNVQRMTGMMFRTNMAEGEAMLFVFPYPHQTAFYMRNTTVPLSAAYIDPAGVIQEIHELKPMNENSVPAATDNIQYVLETPVGWFAKNGIGPGAVLKTELGSLETTFFKRR